MLRIAICEKDQRQRSELLDYISMDTDIEDDYITECFSQVVEVKKRLDENDFNFDILFLMMDSVGVDSLALLQYIREKKFDVDVFFIADTVDFVTEAFRCRAFAYLVKPFDLKKFTYEMKQYLKEKTEYQKDYLAVSVQGKEQMIPLNAVLYFTSNVRKIGAIFLNDDKEVWFYGKLDDLEQRLKTYGFIRCHQSYLINGHKIEGISGNEIVTSGGSFQISRKYTENVKEEWEKIRKKLYEMADIASLEKKRDREIDENDLWQEEQSTVVLTNKFSSVSKYGLIIGIRGSGQNTSYRLYHEEEILIGRDSSQVQILVKHRAVSRKHCGIRFDENKQCYYVCDYSKNGTTISGYGRLPKEQWTDISRDSLLLLGNEECSFLLV